MEHLENRHYPFLGGEGGKHVCFIESRSGKLFDIRCKSFRDEDYGIYVRKYFLFDTDKPEEQYPLLESLELEEIEEYALRR